MVYGGVSAPPTVGAQAVIGVGAGDFAKPYNSVKYTALSGTTSFTAGAIYEDYQAAPRNFDDTRNLAVPRYFYSGGPEGPGHPDLYDHIVFATNFAKAGGQDFIPTSNDTTGIAITSGLFANVTSLVGSGGELEGLANLNNINIIGEEAAPDYAASLAPELIDMPTVDVCEGTEVICTTEGTGPTETECGFCFGIGPEGCTSDADCGGAPLSCDFSVASCFESGTTGRLASATYQMFANGGEQQFPAWPDLNDGGEFDETFGPAQDIPSPKVFWQNSALNIVTEEVFHRWGVGGQAGNIVTRLLFEHPTEKACDGTGMSCTADAECAPDTCDPEISRDLLGRGEAHFAAWVDNRVPDSQFDDGVPRTGTLEGNFIVKLKDLSGTVVDADTDIPYDDTSGLLATTIDQCEAFKQCTGTKTFCEEDADCISPATCDAAGFTAFTTHRDQRKDGTSEFEQYLTGVRKAEDVSVLRYVDFPKSPHTKVCSTDSGVALKGTICSDDLDCGSGACEPASLDDPNCDIAPAGSSGLCGSNINSLVQGDLGFCGKRVNLTVLDNIVPVNGLRTNPANGSQLGDELDAKVCDNNHDICERDGVPEGTCPGNGTCSIPVDVKTQAWLLLTRNTCTGTGDTCTADQDCTSPATCDMNDPSQVELDKLETLRETWIEYINGPGLGDFDATGRVLEGPCNPENNGNTKCLPKFDSRQDTLVH